MYRHVLQRQQVAHTGYTALALSPDGAEPLVWHSSCHKHTQQHPGNTGPGLFPLHHTTSTTVSTTTSTSMLVNSTNAAL
jgi:hypothetical protein